MVDRTINNNSAGATWMVLATMAFVIMDSLIKAVGATLHFAEVAFFRSLFGLAVLVPMLLKAGLQTLKVKRPKLLVWRGVLGALATWTSYAGVILAPLTTATSLTFSRPLFVILLSACFLGECLTRARCLAIFCGGLGVYCLTTGNQVGSFDLGGLLVLSSAFLNAGILIVVKELTKTESSLTITCWMAILIGFVSAPLAFQYWLMPSPLQLFLLVLIGGVASAGQFAVAQALRTADASTVAPLDALKLLWAILIGFLVFQEVPEARSVIGGLLLVSSALAALFFQKLDLIIENQFKFLKDKICRRK